MPYVTLKVAQTLDGKIATSTGESKWITGPEARQFGHMIRNQVDAILVGIGTILKDDPSLTTRIEDGGNSHDPARIILDSHLRIPLDAKVLNIRSNAKTYIATTVNAPTSKMKEIKGRKAEILIIDPDEDGRLSFPSLMDELAKLGMTNLLIEGGAQVNAAALRASVVDRVLFFIAPKILGGDNARGSVGGGSPEYLSDAIDLNIIKHTNLGNDILIEGVVKRDGEKASERTPGQTSEQPSDGAQNDKPAKRRRRRRRPSAKKKVE
jgi:diaminohydroxyphosphoribosylaminopyrimidine deaminase/5-amino-6-(5-phosphoribosylamino)uracil reductase